MKNRVFVLAAIFSLLVCSGHLAAKQYLIPEERKGADLIVKNKDGQQIIGELIAVKQTSLLFVDSQSGADVSVSIDDIREIRIVKKSKALVGAGIGFLVSSVSLCGLWWATDPEGFTDPEGGGPLVVAAIFGLPGLLVGGIVGAILSKSKTIQMEGKSDAEIKEILEKLRHQARITNAQ